jgi:hypothetical protein
LPLAAMASILVVFFSGIFLTVRISAFDTVAEGHHRGSSAECATRSSDRQTHNVIQGRSAEMTPEPPGRLNDPLLKISLVSESHSLWGFCCS